LTMDEIAEHALEQPMRYVCNFVRGSAFHEAGHAVVAQYFGLKITALEIREDGSGKTETSGAIDDLSLIDRIALYCAGQASRTVFKCRSHAIAVSDCHGEIKKFVEGLTEDHSLELRNAGYRRAIEILKSNAPEVERLANLLIQKRRIDGNEMDQGEQIGDIHSDLLPAISCREDIASPALAPGELDEQTRLTNILARLARSGTEVSTARPED